MKNRIKKLLSQIGVKAKLRKAANEYALWVYPLDWQGRTICKGFILVESDLAHNDEYLIEYLKCILDKEFDHTKLV